MKERGGHRLGDLGYKHCPSPTLERPNSHSIEFGAGTLARKVEDDNSGWTRCVGHLRCDLRTSCNHVEQICRAGRNVPNDGTIFSLYGLDERVEQSVGPRGFTEEAVSNCFDSDSDREAERAASLSSARVRLAKEGHVVPIGLL